MNNAGWGDIFEAAQHKDLEAIKYYIEKKNVFVNTTNSKGQTVAHIAVENGQFFVVKYLVDKDPSIVTLRDNLMGNILIRAVEKNAYDIVAFLIEDCREDIFKEHNRFYGNTVLHLAALHGHLTLVKYFMEDQNINCNLKNDVGETPLFFAVENVHMPVVRYLVEKQRVDVFITDENNDHILFVSAWKGDLTVPKYILDERRKAIDLNFKNLFGETLLHRSVEYNHLNFIEYLVQEKQVLVDEIDESGKTPLHYAVEQGNLTIVEYLCEHGANDRDRTILKATKDQKIIEYLKTVATKRTRRSISSPFGFASITNRRSPLWSYEWERIPIGDDMRIGNDEIVPIENRVFSRTNGILIFAGLYFNYLTKIIKFRTPHQRFPTPSEILRNKMDSLAINTIENERNVYELR